MTGEENANGSVDDQEEETPDEVEESDEVGGKETMLAEDHVSEAEEALEESREGTDQSEPQATEPAESSAGTEEQLSAAIVGDASCAESEDVVGEDKVRFGVLPLRNGATAGMKFSASVSCERRRCFHPIH